MEKVILKDGVETIAVPKSLLLGNEYFRNLEESLGDFHEIDIRDIHLNVDLWSLIKILFYDATKDGYNISVQDILTMDKLLITPKIAHFENYRIVSGQDSKILYEKCKCGNVNLEELPPEIQEAVVLESIFLLCDGNKEIQRVLNPDIGLDIQFLDKYFIPIWLDKIVRDPWLFWFYNRYVYREYIFDKPNLLTEYDYDTQVSFDFSLKRIRKNCCIYPDPKKDLDNPYIILDGPEPFVLDYLKNPETLDKSIITIKNRKQFILYNYLNELDFDLVRKMIDLGADIYEQYKVLNTETRQYDNVNLLQVIVDFNLEDLDQKTLHYPLVNSVDKLRIIQFFLDLDYDLTRFRGKKNNIFLFLFHILKDSLYVLEYSATGIHIMLICKILQNLSKKQESLLSLYSHFNKKLNTDTSEVSHVFKHLLQSHYHS